MVIVIYILGAGVIQGLDERDSSVSTSRFFQALIYHAELSGGAWLLSSLMAIEYATISDLQCNLWNEAL